MNEVSLVKVSVLHEKEVIATTSLQVAAYFGKEHFHVMRDIKEVVSKCSASFNASNFGLVDYEDAKGERRPMYILSKDGFMMLVMGYTGEKAMALKEAYIAQFNAMEEQLRGGAARPAFSMDDRLKAGAFLLSVAGITGNQQALALDKLYRKFVGASVLESAQVQLVSPTQNQLVTPTELGAEMDPKRQARVVNSLLARAGLQVWLSNKKKGGKWDPTDEGKAFGAVLQDVGKKHSDGTPVRQLKWTRTEKLLRLLREQARAYDEDKSTAD